jgi:hypothetical protein
MNLFKEKKTLLMGDLSMQRKSSEQRALWLCFCRRWRLTTG